MQFTRTSLAIFGSTGSIGKSTLDVVSRNAEAFNVEVLAANTDVETLWQQVQTYRPAYAAMADSASAAELEQRVKAASLGVRVLAGPESLVELAALDTVDAVMAAIVGAAGLPSALAAAQAGKRLLLANKESLVVAGELLMNTVRDSGATLLPIDSEHNAVFQCWPHAQPKGRDTVRRILLTASGGPFREWSSEQMQKVTPAQAVAHPNWSMGAKISVDSATMMNKGLEVIEACWLFDCPESAVEVVVHPQSTVHSMVEYCDGSVLAELGHADMRTPIAHALAWPDRIDAGVSAFDITKIAQLEFYPPDEIRFPCLRLAREAAQAGGGAAAALNAANEIAVELFLQERVGFNDIASLVDAVLTAKSWSTEAHGSLEELLSIDSEARAFAREQAVLLT